MTTIVTRSGKGSALSWVEADANFTNLNNDKLETSTVGVTVQPHSSNLDSFATIAPTAAGLALLDDVDATAQRTTLGLGNVDNTSDASKNSAIATLTNKTITTPIVDTSITFSGVLGKLKINGFDAVSMDAVGKVTFPQNVIPVFRVIGTAGAIPAGRTRITWASSPVLVGATMSGFDVIPQVAGYYQVNLQVITNVPATTGMSYGSIDLSGTQLVTQVQQGVGSGCFIVLSWLVYCNGTTDAIGGSAYNNLGGYSLVSSVMSGILIKEA